MTSEMHGKCQFVVKSFQEIHIPLKFNSFNAIIKPSEKVEPFSNI